MLEVFATSQVWQVVHAGYALGNASQNHTDSLDAVLKLRHPRSHASWIIFERDLRKEDTHGNAE